MDDFIKALLSLSVSGTLLLLFILGLKPLYKSKFSRHWQYYIWIIVVLRFLLPFAPNTVNVGSLFALFDPAAATDENPASPHMSMKADGNEATREQSQEREQVQGQVQTQTQMQGQESKNATDPVMAAGKPHSPSVYLFFVWAALAALLFVRKVTLYQGFIQYLRAGSTEVSDIRLLNLLSDCAEKLNVKTRVELYQNALIASPMMIGFFRPSIVLPAHEFKDKELSYIFVHELIHGKQKDMFYKWLIQIVVCVHWFNPFAYLLGKEVNQACELACDEKVISVLGDPSRREYGDTLISFLKSDHSYKSSLASVALTEGAEQLKERLGAIMNFRKRTKLMAVISCMAAILLSIGGFSVGVYAAAPTGSYIGQDAAKAAALAHAGVRESDTHYCNSWLEYENRRPAYYEVEFVAGNIEYEYEIDMYDGTVLKCDTEYHDYTYSKPVGGNPVSGGSGESGAADIGQAAAKQAAFSHAGLSEADVYHLKVEQDYDGGWLEYEVKFKYNGMEYEYDIDAATGNILKYDCDGAAVSKGSGSRGTSGGAGASGSVGTPGGAGASGSAADIGQAAAKQAALNHAGLSESQVYHMEIELDYDDGRLKYEVEFKYNRMEYGYDIDAATGNILKYECDRDE